MDYVHVFKDGRVEVSNRTMKGSIIVAKGVKEHLTEIVRRICRLSYDGKTWIAAEVRDADTDEDKMEGLIEFERQFFVRHKRLKETLQ